MRLVGPWKVDANTQRNPQFPDALQGGGSCLNGVFELVCLDVTLVRTGFVRRVGGMDGMAVRMWMLQGCTQSCRACQGWVAFWTCATCAYLIPHYLARLILVALRLGGPIWWASLSTSRRPLRSMPVSGYQTSCCTYTSHDFPSTFLILFLPRIIVFSWLCSILLGPFFDFGLKQLVYPFRACILR
jgi:hypothetical protein